MKPGRILPILFILAAASFVFLSSTLARYTTKRSGSDLSLIAQWNFGARGEDDMEGVFYNKGFTFDLFSAASVKPMDFGSKSFTFTGGGSDTAIAYDVQMNAADLLFLTNATVANTADADIYAPFIFKIEASISEGASDPLPALFSPPLSYGGDWFRPMDLTTDENGYFSIFDKTAGVPSFSVHSTDQVTVTVYWQWNTSCYINDTGAADISPDISTGVSGGYPPYYQAAYDEYYGPGGLDDQRAAASDAVVDYLNEHGGPSGGTWVHIIPCDLSDAQHNAVYGALSPEEQPAYLEAHNGVDDGTGTMIWGAHGFPCPADHFAQYNALVADEDAAILACQTSLLKAYDDYDTSAMDALDAKESVKVIFRITGEQIKPE